MPSSALASSPTYPRSPTPPSYPALPIAVASVCATCWVMAFRMSSPCVPSSGVMQVSSDEVAGGGTPGIAGARVVRCGDKLFVPVPKYPRVVLSTERTRVCVPRSCAEGGSKC